MNRVEWFFVVCLVEFEVLILKERFKYWRKNKDKDLFIGEFCLELLIIWKLIYFGVWKEGLMDREKVYGFYVCWS